VRGSAGDSPARRGRANGKRRKDAGSANSGALSATEDAPASSFAAGHAAEGLSGRASGRTAPATLAAWTLAALAAAGYAWAAIYRFEHFGANAYDLGLFDQTIWGYSRFDWIPNTILRIPHELGDHTDFTLMVLAPLYWVWSDPRMLLLAQAAMLAGAALPIFWWAREELGAAAALLFEAAYLVFFGVLAGDIFDFHELALAAPLVSVALWAMLTRRDVVLGVCVALLLLTKEDVALTLVGFAAFIAFVQRRWRLGGAIAGVSVAWFALAYKVLIPAFAGGRAYTHWSYDALGSTPGSAARNLVLHPIRSVELFVTPHAKRVGLFNVFASWLFLPLVSPLLIVMLPTLAERFLSSIPSYWAQGFHYSLLIAPMLAFAAVDTTARGLRFGRSRGRERTIVLLAGGGVLAACLFFTFVRLKPLDELRRYTAPETVEEIERCLDAIPPDASVSATSALVPRLSQRRHVYVLDGRPLPGTRFYAINTTTWIFPLTAANLGRTVERLLDGRYGVRCQGAVTVVLEQGARAKRLDPRLRRALALGP